MNAISTVRDGLEESPVMILQETVLAPVAKGIEGQRKEGRTHSEMEGTAPPILPYQSRVPYPQKLA